MPSAPDFESFVARIASRIEPASIDAVSAGGRDPAAGDSIGIVRAAVMLFLRPDLNHRTGDDAEPAQVLFIKRAEQEGDPWSGHVAFPGGRREPADKSLLDVALREAREEVGIDARTQGSVLGRLPTLRPTSARLPPLEVTPFVAALRADAAVRTQPEEVANAFWIPLAALRNGRSATVRFGDAGGFPAYPSPVGPIWGMTERILTGFLELIGPEMR